jgi:serine/threonine protein kinase
MLRDEGYGVKADIFSLGSIFFNLLTGEPLFNGDSAKDIFNLNRKCDITPVAHLMDQIPALAQDLLKSLINPNPNIRPSASEALQHPWFSQD